MGSSLEHNGLDPGSTYQSLSESGEKGREKKGKKKVPPCFWFCKNLLCGFKVRWRKPYPEQAAIETRHWILVTCK